MRLSPAALAVVLARAAVGEAQQDTGIFREVTSNADGTYFVSGIVRGVYELAGRTTTSLHRDPREH